MLHAFFYQYVAQKTWEWAAGDEAITKLFHCGKFIIHVDENPLTIYDHVTEPRLAVYIHTHVHLDV